MRPSRSASCQYGPHLLRPAPRLPDAWRWCRELYRHARRHHPHPVPRGLVAAALSFAVLPTLSAHAREGDMERFKATLLLGFRIGLLLMTPAAAGLIILRVPIVDLLFMHHKYTAQNAALTAVALQNYAYQLPFVAIDQLLIAAFYARKNTIIPVTVGIAGVVWYLLIALPFWQTVGMPALVLANTFQNAMHPVIMLILLRLAIGSLHVRSTIPA